MKSIIVFLTVGIMAAAPLFPLSASFPGSGSARQDGMALFDDFNGASVDPSKWRVYRLGGLDAKLSAGRLSMNGSFDPGKKICADQSWNCVILESVPTFSGKVSYAVDGSVAAASAIEYYQYLELRDSRGYLVTWGSFLSWAWGGQNVTGWWQYHSAANTSINQGAIDNRTIVFGAWHSYRIDYDSSRKEATFWSDGVNRGTVGNLELVPPLQIRLNTGLKSDPGRVTTAYDNAWVDPAPPTGIDWREMTPATSPSPREGVGLVYDSMRDRVVMFGGRLGSTYSTDTWLYSQDNATWTPLTTSGSPPGRHSFSMVYDLKRDRVVLHGGFSGAWMDDTWEFNPANASWYQLFPTQSPGGRSGSAFAFMEHRGRFMIWGGNSGGGPLADTWEFDVANNTWRNTGATGAPGGQSEPAMSYDGGSRRLILFGGHAGSNVTYSYSYESNTWVAMPQGPSPSGRYGHSMTYDSRQDRVVMFAGSGGGNETWTYDFDNNTWKKLVTTKAPSARFRHLLTFDQQSAAVVLFGGDPGGGETWALFGVGGPSPNMTVASNKTSYSPGEQVTIYANYTGTAGTQATIEVDYPNGTPLLVRTEPFVSGKATTTLRLPAGAPGGPYRMSASTVDANATGYFDVKLPPPPPFVLRIVSVSTPVGAKVGQAATFSVVIENTHPKEWTLVLALQIQDSSGVPVPTSVRSVKIPTGGLSTFNFTASLLKDGTPGMWSVQAQLLTDLPSKGGYALDARSASFQVG